MKIKWLGHASVLITSDSGLRIITDPFRPGRYTTPDGYLFYFPINERADIVAVSHDHVDHDRVGEVQGEPEIIRGDEIKGKGPVSVKGIEFKAVPTFHDEKEGKVLGENSVLCFEVDGFKFCHNGDLGHRLTDDQLAQIGEVDILLLCAGQCKPVGERQSRIDEAGQRIRLPFEKYVIDCEAANQVYEQIAPKVTIPIHCSNDRCSFKIASMETFLIKKENVIRLEVSEVELKKETLAAGSRIIALKPAL
ncbi:MAG: MBL fold metallo-hydrolase [Pseudomonadota bacterium]